VESTAGFVWAACARFAGNRKAGFRRARRHSRLIRCRRGKSIAFDSVGRRAPEGGAEAGPSGGLGAPKRAISGDRSGTGSARTLYASACNSSYLHNSTVLPERAQHTRAHHVHPVIAMPGGSESTTAAVRRALELGTTAVQEVRTAAAEEQRKALEDNNRHWEERLRAEELRWESASRTAQATLGERLTQRFEAAATEQLTKALAAAKAAYAKEAMAAQRAAVDEAVAACAREAAVAQIKAVEAERRRCIAEAEQSPRQRAQGDAAESKQALNETQRLTRELALTAGRVEAAEARAAIERQLLASAVSDEIATAVQHATEAAVRATVAECQETTRQLLVEARRVSEVRERQVVLDAIAAMSMETREI